MRRRTDIKRVLSDPLGHCALTNANLYTSPHIHERKLKDILAFVMVWVVVSCFEDTKEVFLDWQMF